MRPHGLRPGPYGGTRAGRGRAIGRRPRRPFRRGGGSTSKRARRCFFARRAKSGTPLCSPMRPFVRSGPLCPCCGVSGAQSGEKNALRRPSSGARPFRAASRNKGVGARAGRWPGLRSIGRWTASGVVPPTNDPLSYAHGVATSSRPFHDHHPTSRRRTRHSLDRRPVSRAKAASRTGRALCAAFFSPAPGPSRWNGQLSLPGVFRRPRPTRARNGKGPPTRNNCYKSGDLDGTAPHGLGSASAHPSTNAVTRIGSEA